MPTSHPDAYDGLDVEEITEDAIGDLSGGERRLVRLVASLGGGRPVDLYENVSVDRPTVALVLAAIAHAAGTHEHSDVIPELERHRDPDPTQQPVPVAPTLNPARDRSARCPGDHTR